ncbi:hypothetical protein CSB20_05555 [bacterium DOLZORAL124_64_63]|nr:MAG: hypothetical protein CSB20_05555 [bacterium DOLZORAL124_64_63]
MSKQKQDHQQEKNMKMAEAGVLFVLVLGVLIFVGVHFSGGDKQAAPITAQQETVAPAPMQQATGSKDPAGGKAVVTKGDATAKPAGSVDPEQGSEQGSEQSSEQSSEPETTLEVAQKPQSEPAQEPVTKPVVVTYCMAEDAYHMGQYAGAAELFDTYTDEHPDNAWGYYMLGLSQWKAGQADMAEESFLTALELKPDHQKSLINYGRVLIDLDRNAEAREQIEIALAADPADISARRVLGRIQHNLGELEAAEQTYLVVLREKQNDAWALNNLGLIRIQQKRFADAIAPLAKATSLKTGVACFENNLGVALEQSGHYGAAGEAFARALAADSSYEKAEISLARIEEMGNTEQDTIDVAALAESFRVEPAVPEVEDMEVAAVGTMLLEALEEDREPATTEVVVPEDDGHRNR